MLSRAQIKYIRSLTRQKYRKEHGAFIAEGDKIAREWLAAEQPVRLIVATGEWLTGASELVARHPEATVVTTDEAGLSQVSALQTPNGVLLVVAMPPPPAELPREGWVLALEDIQDPGNMGTLIRIADWFGVGDVVCSPGSADFYNPKVVQAAMGGHLRIRLHEADLHAYVRTTSLPAVAATLKGASVYTMKPLTEGILLIGNESRGLSAELTEAATHQVTIPRRGGAESLNAAVSAGIIFSHLIGG